MVSNPHFTERLAERLQVPASRVRLVYHDDQGNWPYRYSENEAGVPTRLGEPEFYNTAIAAMQMPDGRWRIVDTPRRPLLSRSLVRWLATFLLAFVVLLPFAYFFARHLARPIREFAEAAERVGNDIEAPAVPVEGSTEIRQAALALNAMQGRLADTLAERTAMIGAIAHDLRTPLARIAFRIERAPPEIRRSVLGDIDQVRAMVSSTIHFVTRGTELGEKEQVDLGLLLERMTADACVMSQDVSLNVKMPSVVIGDSVALERLIQNVIDNAINYAGSAEIEVEMRHGRVLVSIGDHGPGLGEELLESVFKPFNRGEPSRNRGTGGVGLGLSIARSIALAHGGTLRAYNRSGGGLLVVADLPAASDRNEPLTVTA
jgi:signal transduction histidine kinase